MKNSITAPPSAPVGVESAKAYCKECNAAGMGNCAHFDECGGARCITCHQQLNQLAQQPAAEYQRMQPCGCVLCVCEDEKRCHGCGAKHCGNRTDHPAYVEQQPAAVDGIKRLTEQQAVIVTGYTGVLCCKFDAFHADLERRAGRPVLTHEMGDFKWIKPLYVDDFIALAAQPGGSDNG